jgi:hypothetical protein
MQYDAQAFRPAVVQFAHDVLFPESCFDFLVAAELFDLCYELEMDLA